MIVICGSVCVWVPIRALCFAAWRVYTGGGQHSNTHPSSMGCTVQSAAPNRTGTFLVLPPRLLSRDWPFAVASEGDEAKAPPTTTLTQADNRLTELGLTSTTIRRLRPYWQYQATPPTAPSYGQQVSTSLGTPQGPSQELVSLISPPGPSRGRPCCVVVHPGLPPNPVVSACLPSPAHHRLVRRLARSLLGPLPFHRPVPWATAIVIVLASPRQLPRSPNTALPNRCIGLLSCTLRLIA